MPIATPNQHKTRFFQLFGPGPKKTSAFYVAVRNNSLADSKKGVCGLSAVLTISSKNYSSWCLRGWLLCRMAGLDFKEEMLPSSDASARAELLVLSPAFLVPALTHNGIKVWDTLAIAEYLNETFPKAGLLPKDAAARAHCRAASGDMHSGFTHLRSA